MNPQLCYYTNTQPDKCGGSKTFSISSAATTISQVKNHKSNNFSCSPTINELISGSLFVNKYIEDKRKAGSTSPEEDMDDTFIEDVLEKEAERLISKLSQGITKTSDNNFVINTKKIITETFIELLKKNKMQVLKNLRMPD